MGTRLSSGLAMLTALFVPLALPAVTIVECVDESGAASYRDRCPPGMTLISTKTLPGEKAPETPPSVSEIAKDNPVTLFVAPNCNACDLVRNLLQQRNIPFAEKDAAADPNAQAELSEVNDGQLTVPTMMVGGQKYFGYNKSELDTALSSVGYP